MKCFGNTQFHALCNILLESPLKILLEYIYLATSAGISINCFGVGSSACVLGIEEDIHLGHREPFGLTGNPSGHRAPKGYTCLFWLFKAIC